MFAQQFHFFFVNKSTHRNIFKTLFFSGACCFICFLCSYFVPYQFCTKWIKNLRVPFSLHIASWTRARMWLPVNECANAGIIPPVRFITIIWFDKNTGMSAKGVCNLVYPRSLSFDSWRNQRTIILTVFQWKFDSMVAFAISQRAHELCDRRKAWIFIRTLIALMKSSIFIGNVIYICFGFSVR